MASKSIPMDTAPIVIRLVPSRDPSFIFRRNGQGPSLRNPPSRRVELDVLLRVSGDLNALNVLERLLADR